VGRIEDVSGLQISQDLGFQRRAWRVERAAWALIVAALAAAVLGFLGGSGPAVDASVSAAAIMVRHDRFGRLGAPTQLDVQLAGPPGMRDVALARAWLERYRVDGYVPEPDSVTAERDRYVYSFEVDRSGVVRFMLTPQAAGVHRGVVWGPADQRVAFSQVVYP
jgi:hypothetical protein